MVDTDIVYHGMGSIVPGAEDYANSKLSGAVYDSADRLIVGCLRDLDTFSHEAPSRLPQSFVSEDLIPKAIFAGHWFFHFGHFMLETLPMLVLAARKDAECPILFFPIGFHLLGRREYLAPHLAAMARYGIDPRRLLMICRPVRVIQLMVLTRPYNLGKNYPPNTVALLRPISPEMLTTSAEIGVYLTRRRLLPSFSRFCLNEYRLESLYRSLGFTILAPEEMTLHQQASAVAEAPVIAALDGSAIYLSVFAAQTEVRCFALRDISSLRLFVEACGHSYKQSLIESDSARAGLFIVKTEDIRHLDKDAVDIWETLYDEDTESQEQILWQAAALLANGRMSEVRRRIIPNIDRLDLRALVLVCMSFDNCDDVEEARDFLRHAVAKAPSNWDIARIWIRFLLRTNDIDEAECVLLRFKSGIDAEWLDFASEAEQKSGRSLLSDGCALALVDSFPPTVASFRYLARKLERVGAVAFASDVQKLGECSTGIFWVKG